MQPLRIKIATDFSDRPGPRYIKEGKNSGELFRKEILIGKYREAKEKGTQLIVDLDGTRGYGTSFLEEAFGGLIREENESYKEILDTIEIISDEEDFLKDDISFYLKDAFEDKEKEK
ncbi:STAS-like domain-containing protein [Ekhidna sp.]|uniref:STAS-like domain-containing protein n=1 Tax=Ekhidna sp. TaxID=2608089 RepID=UPI003B5AF920